ncbi:MAG: 1,4-alpha-glucan branching protein GlgB [Actinomycetota bacterium]
MPKFTPSIPELLRPWLTAQRWFPAKGQEFVLHRLGGIQLQDPSGEVGLEVHIVAVHTANAVHVVNVPLSYRREPLAGGDAALVGRAEQEPADSGGDDGDAAAAWAGSGDDGANSGTGERWIYDGAHDPVFVAAWLELMRRQAVTGDGHTRGHAGAGFDTWPEFSTELEASVLLGEQSNTSVVVQSAHGPLIVKFFRVLEAGANPDVEVGVLLTDAGCREVPATYGWVTGGWLTPGQDDDGSDRLWDTGHLSVLREFLPDSQDAWRTASGSALDGTDFSSQARQLGAVTGRIHRSLRDAAGSHRADAQEVSAFKAALAERIRWGWAQAGASVGPMDEAVQELLDRLDQVTELPELQRIHGDYHLGQVLDSAERGWVVLDFEGEPLRPMGERGTDDVPLRDVVGMLRSFDYAAGVARLAGPDDAAAAAADEWAAQASSAFLDGYREETGDPVDTSSTLYLALLLDKALYEVVYEQRNRPRWVKVPVRGVREALAPLAGTGAGAFGSRDMAATGVGAAGAAAGIRPTTAAAPVRPAAAGSDPSPGSRSAGSPSSGRRNATPVPVDPEVLTAVAHGAFHQPHAVLGAHLDDHGHVTVRTRRPLADSVTVVTPSLRVPMEHEHEGIWVAVFPADDPGHVPDYRLEVAYDGGAPSIVDDPYHYLPSLGEIDLHLIGEGRHETLWTALGSQVRRYNSALGDTAGASFAVWAPNARAVRVMGDFNHWDGARHAMRSMGGSGVWELFIPGVEAGAVYKYELLGQDGQWREKADPMARWTEVPPLTGSRVVESHYRFGDQEWMERRAVRDPHNGPMSVYEVHLGSWRLGLDYRQLADQLAEYVSWQGFTHVEFMPVAEHPFGGSWGYQVTSYYAPTSRFGHPDDFKYLVDKLHQAGIGVILDWVPAHFPKDEWALARFDGQPLYEHADPRLGEHPDWGTLIFDFGRREVRNFLVANALYWLEEFHIDGLRVDAVASMLYRDYSRKEGEWFPNVKGGRENLEAISFLQEANATAYKRVPGIVMIAEESTAFDGVTRPTSAGGLGFGLKWNMGWMHDTLEYIAEDPVNRMYHHSKATFSMVYAYTENFLLPISHDEVVHGKGSMLRKMPGDRWQQLANLRAYLAFQWAHPGKQLIFMGTEFGQESEWSEQHGLDWWLSENVPHKGLQRLVRNLNGIYRSTPALYERDNEPAGFQWIDENDGVHNTLSFIRWDQQGNPLVCVANFAGAPHEGFRLGLPWAGDWDETLNTDAAEYGGSGVANLGAITAEEGGWKDSPASAILRVPPLGVLYLKPSAGPSA